MQLSHLYELGLLVPVFKTSLTALGDAVLVITAFVNGTLLLAVLRSTVPSYV